jgi:hypothetical protein
MLDSVTGTQFRKIFWFLFFIPDDIFIYTFSLGQLPRAKCMEEKVTMPLF